MVITKPTVDDFSDTTVMRVIRKIVNYICSDSGLVAQINNNDITGFTSNYTSNVLKIDATKGDGTTLPVCNVTIEGGGSSTGNPYPTAVSGTVGADGNITFTITMSSGSPLTTTINMNYFASADDLSDLQEQVTGIKPIVTTNLESLPPTITVSVNGKSSTANLPSGGGSTEEWEELDINNLPTDFTANDIILMDVCLSFNWTFAYPSSWNSSFSGTVTLEEGNKDFNTLPALITLLPNDSIFMNALAIATNSLMTYMIGCKSYRVDNWNNTSGTAYLFSLEMIVFNGASAETSTRLIITRNNLSQYCTRIVRLKKKN